MAQAVEERFDGEIPRDLDDLVTLPGVGRKTGNVVRSVAFDLPGLPVDTHVGRLSRRLKLTTENDPVAVERDLNALVPPEERGRFSLRLIEHGRRVCIAAAPAVRRVRPRVRLPLRRQVRTGRRQRGQEATAEGEEGAGEASCEAGGDMSDAVDVRVANEGELLEFGALREQGYAVPGRSTREVGRPDAVDRAGRTAARCVSRRSPGRDAQRARVPAVVRRSRVADGWRRVGGGGSRGAGSGDRATACSTRALELMAERGEVISTLGPATSWVYRKSGWEHGGLYAVSTVPTSDLVGLGTGSCRERRANRADREGIIAVYDRVAPSRPGFLARPSWLWDERLTEAPLRFVYVVERDGRVDGYVSYSQSTATRGYTVWVDDLVAAGSETEQTLWRHLGAHVAQAKSITIAGVPLDTLALLIPEQTIRLLGQQLWMTRIVDAPRRRRAARRIRAGCAPTCRSNS